MPLRYWLYLLIGHYWLPLIADWWPLMEATPSATAPLAAIRHWYITPHAIIVTVITMLLWCITSHDTHLGLMSRRFIIIITLSSLLHYAAITDRLHWYCHMMPPLPLRCHAITPCYAIMPPLLRHYMIFYFAIDTAAPLLPLRHAATPLAPLRHYADIHNI